MRRLLRWLGGGFLGLGLGLLALLSPVAYVETQCRGEVVARPQVSIVAQTRPEIRTLLTYPEWHIVHAYDDYAETIRQGDPDDFDFLAAITGYWRALCTLTQESAAMGEIDTPTRQMVHVIGVSFTAEMLAKAAYEETLGRVATWIRGSDPSALDRLSAEQAAHYAEVLQQTPWYRYDFRADAAALDAASTGSFRDRERALALGLEHRVRAAYAGVIESAVAATGQDELTLQMVMTGLPRSTIEAQEGVRLLRVTTSGMVIETPRYRALTHLLAGWAEGGAEFVEIAGNDEILFTAISDQPSQPGALANLPRQGYGDTRHLFLVRVADLAERLRDLPQRGLRLEHIHDY